MVGRFKPIEWAAGGGGGGSWKVQAAPCRSQDALRRMLPCLRPAPAHLGYRLVLAVPLLLLPRRLLPLGGHLLLEKARLGGVSGLIPGRRAKQQGSPSGRARGLGLHYLASLGAC